MADADLHCYHVYHRFCCSLLYTSDGVGGFSLFLCVAIGIRFLVKPDSKERPEKDGAVKLSAKEIAVSLFFGLTIGFGTGFFGSGGGMMMLIVFTAMLGYDRKTAVGTSTFICSGFIWAIL